MDIYEKALEKLKNEKHVKSDFIKEVAILALEYFTLDGLESAKRATDIENELFLLIEKEG